ncbi:chemotaxis protein CheW [Cellulomonas fimi]|uniref:chemotaxis protein CheW n=1 Tax=Cellulomonas fimi TaxID=1708 RepID=UPI00234D83F2|nr:chemotaxis protein CheW [Cellulomonas fimi]MDC7120493.1 chemotaxis protein CheW [Cellulomonas fimi]
MATDTLPGPVTARHDEPIGQRVRALVDTVRWAPAPRFEGTAAHRWRFVAYLGGSMLAWTVVGLAVTAGLGRVLGLS